MKGAARALRGPLALSGLRDKLYWRISGRSFHCFKRAPGRVVAYASLCGRVAPLARSYGQSTDRPPPVLRCALCDGREADRRGWDESGPETAGWRARWEAHFSAM